MIASRAGSAIFAGYLLAATACGLMAIALPMAAADSVLVATMLSFTVYACAALYSFSVPSSTRAWRDLLLASAGLYLLILLVG
ncbi:hypothetical protein [Shewanella waksmanii]|nr:hypothetical protein [Shewanella waksmanii]